MGGYVLPLGDRESHERFAGLAAQALVALERAHKGRLWAWAAQGSPGAFEALARPLLALDQTGGA